MKTLLIATALLPQPLFAAVIVDDATLISPSLFGNYDLRLPKSINGSGQGLFYVSFDNLGNGNFGFSISRGNSYSIAEGISLYLAPAFTRFDAQYVSSHTPLFTNYAPADWTVSIPLNSSLVVSYWDDRPPFLDPPSTADNYGWVRLTNTPTGLVASAGATAIGGGIIVGTTAQVPEPTGAILLLGGGALLALRRRRG